MVYDCAASLKGVSLNNQCMRGPNNKLIIDVLLRFRRYPWAITADIEGMYNQVRVPVEDRNSLRFLWALGGIVKEFRMTSHLSGGVWCASSSAYALRRTVLDTEVSPLVRDVINQNFYVDDLLCSVKTKREATEILQCVKEVLGYGGFYLTKYIVNDTHLLEQIPEPDRAKEVKEIAQESWCKALGIRWDFMTDEFFYVSRHQGSKRKLGSTGFYGPVHLGRYWSVTSRHWSVYLQYLDRVADVKKQRIMLYKLF